MNKASSFHSLSLSSANGSGYEDSLTTSISLSLSFSVCVDLKCKSIKPIEFPCMKIASLAAKECIVSGLSPLLASLFLSPCVHVFLHGQLIVIIFQKGIKFWYWSENVVTGWNVQNSTLWNFKLYIARRFCVIVWYLLLIYVQCTCVNKNRMLNWMSLSKRFLDLFK